MLKDPYTIQNKVKSSKYSLTVIYDQTFNCATGMPILQVRLPPKDNEILDNSLLSLLSKFLYIYSQNKTTTTNSVKQNGKTEKKKICLNRKTNLWNPNNLEKYYSALCSNSNSQPLLSFSFHSTIIIITNT